MTKKYRNMEFGRYALLLVFIAWLGSGLSWAADFHVSETGTGDDCSELSPCDLQTALTASGNNDEGDTINLKAGVYVPPPVG